MNKIEKGRPGHIKAQKNRYLAGALAEFGIVIGLLVFGYVQTKTKLNLFTLFAILGCLPASKMLAEFITMAPHKGILPEKYEEIKAHAPLLIDIYDLIITSSEKVMPVSAVIITGHMVCGYTENPKTNEVKCAEHIKETLENNHYDKVTVKIFHDYKAFLARVDGLNSMASVEKKEPGKRETNMKALILTLSM